jgi:hypothetical protein
MQKINQEHETETIVRPLSMSADNYTKHFNQERVCKPF